MLTDARSGYGGVTIVLHWVSAALILFLFGLGLYMTGLDYYDPWYHKGPALHVSIGLVVLVLTAVRLIWRLLNPQPQPLASYSRSVRLLSSLMKYSLYGLLVGLLVSGYLVTTAEGKPASLFEVLEFPALVKLDGSTVDRAGWFHQWLAWAIVSFAGLHAIAALKHHFFQRDRTLLRMLKSRRRSDGQH